MKITNNNMNRSVQIPFVPDLINRPSTIKNRSLIGILKRAVETILKYSMHKKMVHK